MWTLWIEVALSKFFMQMSGLRRTENHLTMTSSFMSDASKNRRRSGELEARLLVLCLNELDVDPLCIVTSSAAWGPVILYFFASFPDLQLAHSSASLLVKDSLTFFFCSKPLQYSLWVPYNVYMGVPERNYTSGYYTLKRQRRSFFSVSLAHSKQVPLFMKKWDQVILHQFLFSTFP